MLQFGKMSRYELGHRRLGHCTNRNIRDTIKHSEGLDDLRSSTFEEHVKCPCCMIGKSTLEDLPRLRNRATEPLAKSIWTHLRFNQSKGIIMQLYLLIVTPNTEIYMVWNWKVRCWKLSRNGTATSPYSDSSITYLWQWEIMQVKINLKKWSLTFFNWWESRTYSTAREQ